jgi:hypothetical protein
MTRIIEGNPASLLNKWPLLLDTNSIKSVGIAWLFKSVDDPQLDGESPTWKFLPKVTGNTALFYNAVFFVRLVFPFGAFFHMRLGSNYLFQCGLGWKLNGRAAILFRMQTDASAAAGTSGPNYGQSSGYEYGTH